MKKTYITTMPDHIGAFLKASHCFAELGINITRVSYNKAIDTNTLFIDAEGTPESLEEADRRLAEIGYLPDLDNTHSIVLLEFCLRDEPGSVTEILTLISHFDFNISYISSQENGSDHQFFKMGLYVDDADKISGFLESAEKICPVRVIDYNHTEKNFDNSIFYRSFVSGITKNIALDAKMKDRLLIMTNLAMQTLDEQGLSPYRTFDSIGKFAELLAASHGAGFRPRITAHKLSENTTLTLIEPPCGSNTAILQSGDDVLFLDTGYACYREEMLPLIETIVPDFATRKKTALITHADLDHCGLLPIFDEIYASEKSAACLRAEFEDQNGFREQNPLHRPYVNICKILTAYAPPDPQKVHVLWPASTAVPSVPLAQVGFFDFGDLHFEVYEGGGGHLAGEIVLIDYEHHIAFTGDVYINLRGLTAEQEAYNRYAPILMTSV
ncbi:MAG: MBL fold metallo-hydrolase, partial [Clostridia bacterium]|nr:MBL fold metallo-hydrolase [Clostridia bacterium]